MNALASKGISKEFKEWIAIAKDRPKWKINGHYRVYFLKLGECREVLGGGPAPPSKL